VLIGVEHAQINMNALYLIQGVYPVRPSLPSSSASCFSTYLYVHGDQNVLAAEGAMSDELTWLRGG
jgi:hypothetical protein